MGRCSVIAQVPVHTPVRICGPTLSVYLDPVHPGAHALLDRSANARLYVLVELNRVLILIVFLIGVA